jgi:ferric-dicitrate binding protein FerR (iron transport regulator)
VLHKELIVKYLEGRLNSSEKALFDTYLQDEGFVKEVDACAKIYHTKISDQADWNIESAWMNLEGKLTEGVKPSQPMYHRRRWFAVAASLILVLGSLFLWKNFLGTQEMGLSLLAGGESVVHELPDGSVITMGEQSTLQLSKDFNQKSRKMRSEGTLFFVVKPDKDRVFEVTNGHLTALVRGTSFEIIENNETCTLHVFTGRVEVLVQEQVYLLNKGDKIAIQRDEVSFVRSTVLEDKPKWVKETLNFNDVPLDVIVKSIEEHYQTSVKVPVDLLQKRFTIKLENLVIEDVMDILSKLTQTTISSNDEGYSLN